MGKNLEKLSGDTLHTLKRRGHTVYIDGVSSPIEHLRNEAKYHNFQFIGCIKISDTIQSIFVNYNAKSAEKLNEQRLQYAKTFAGFKTDGLYEFGNLHTL